MIARLPLIRCRISASFSSSGLDKLVAASYSLLGLISFLTAGEDECRAWTIKKGTKAPQAAGKIHTDFERGFIKAEVVNYQDLLLQEGWRIMVVLVTSTVLVLGTTALVVDRVYRLELKLARRSRRHV